MAYRVGEQLGNYRLERLLGRGGFAEVYLGEHIHIPRQAAIKVLHTRLAEDAIANFRREAQIIAELQHPHIVTIFDFDLQENILFLVMDYYPRGSLRQRHPRGTRLALDMVVDYVGQLAQALDYAHGKRIIHRDVKPENMLIGPHDEVILADFGIATIAHNTTSMNQQVFAGTPYYMAPEQIRSNARPASDQYTLGAVVYEWLTGAPPFQGTVLEIYVKQVLAEPRPLQEIVPDLPLDVEEVVLTALRKDPQQRFASVTAFATALAAAARAEQSLALSRSHVEVQQESQSRASLRQEVAPTQLVQEYVTGRQSGRQENSGTPAPVTAIPPEIIDVIPPLVQRPRSGKGRALAIVALVLLFLLSGGALFWEECAGSIYS